jgi:hypothetical protein
MKESSEYKSILQAKESNENNKNNIKIANFRNVKLLID